MHGQLTDADREALERAETFEEAADVAVMVLTRMQERGRPIFQVCGPMSTGGLGTLETNMARFERAIDSAHARGLTVFNQIPFQEAIVRLSNFEEGREEYNLDILEIFYRRIFECGYVSTTLFLPDWESSTGARWERELVSSLGIEIREYPLEWIT